MIQATRGPVLVLAPVGSGKTSVLALRLHRALAEGFDAARCLCLTFTNRAARELRERLAALRGSDGGNPTGDVEVRTFHGFCAALLRTEAEEAGLRPDFGIYDDGESEDLLGRLIARQGENSGAAAGGALPEADLSAREIYFRWGRLLSALPGSECRPEVVPARVLSGQPDLLRRVIRLYLRELGERNVLDFPLLVYRSRALFNASPAMRSRWEQRYDWIQVDEIQDTHRSEWEVVRLLAYGHGNLALFGDLDQTIYGWRGSEPGRILDEFEREFDAPGRYTLSLNQRGTRSTLELADRIASGLRSRQTGMRPADGLPEGEPVEWILAGTPREEAAEVVRHILRRFSVDPESRGSTALLCRGNRLGRMVRDALEDAGVPAACEEDLRFTSRPEVRALLAPLRLLVNPEDLGALRRWLGWYARDRALHEAMLKIHRYGPECHLRITDMVRPDTQRLGDPYAPLLKAWDERFLIVLDFETTGLDTERDEIVEIACQRHSSNLEIDRFHRLLRPAVDPGASSKVHGISAEQLRREGHDPQEALRDLLAYLGDELVCGHNLAFDLAILESNCRRLGLAPPELPAADTLWIARRVVGTGSMKLGDLRRRLGLSTEPTHRAMDDVSATAELLKALLPLLDESREDREDLVREHREFFRPCFEQLQRWRSLSATLRPWELCEYIAADPAFTTRLPTDDPRRSAVDRLVAWLKALDEAAGMEDRLLPPRSALREYVSHSAMARPVDLLAPGTVPVLTIHAAKGMEFDHVYLYHAARGTIPDFRNDSGDKREEERRVLYVAVTRARRSLTISASRRSGRGHDEGWSEFLSGIAPAH